MNTAIIDIEGSEYELIPDRSEDSLAVYLDINVHRDGKTVALLKLRCAVYEPEYEKIASTSVEVLLEMAMRREGIADNVRGALHWQSELQRINPEWGVSPVYSSWFPKNYEQYR